MRWKWIGFAALAVVLALAGCGGGDGEGGGEETDGTETSVSSSPTSAIAAAAAKTEDAQSAKIFFTATLETGQGEPVSFDGEGAFAGDRGRMTTDLSGLPGSSGFGGGEFEFVFQGTVFYLRFPGELGAQLPGGKRWLKFDLQALGEESGIDLQQIQQFRQSDPTQTLQYLRGASDDFEEVGEEAVRGVSTTHYRGTVDLQKVADQLPAEDRENYEGVIESAGTSKIPTEVWLDDDGLPRRFRYEMSFPGEGGQEGTMSVTTELFDFGTDVSVEPPPASEVVDFAELFGQGTG
jgi:hypothetical protein